MTIKNKISSMYPFCMIQTLLQKMDAPDQIREDLEKHPSIKEKIQSILLDRYIKVSVSCITTEPAFILIAYLVLLYQPPLFNANIWLGLALAAAALKMGSSWIYNKGYRSGDYNFWLKLVYVRILSTGIVWGSLASIFMPPNSHYAQLIISLLVFSIVSWFTSSLAAVVKGYFLLLISIFVPYGIWLSQQDQHVSFTVVIISCWIVLMMVSIVFIRNLLVTSLFLRHQVEDLLKESQDANRELLKEIYIRKEAEIKLANLASHDSLTGLPNRAFLHSYMKEVCAKVHLNESMIGFLFLDLDKFKPVNDLLGHEVGDLLLVEVGKRLKNKVRASDMAARLGGDEFILVITNVKSLLDLEKVAEEIKLALNQPFNIQEHKNVDVTPSIGIAIYPQDSSDVTEVIKKADEAMYGSKKLGGNTFVFYHDLK